MNKMNLFIFLILYITTHLILLIFVLQPTYITYIHAFAESGEAVRVISLVNKFMSAVAWAVVYLHSTEVIPTKCRQSILTLLNISSRFGGLLSQYLVHASKFQKNSINNFGDSNSFMKCPTVC